MNFAQELNVIQAEAGIEDGRLYLTDGQGDEVLKTPTFVVSQCNAGVDLRLGKNNLFTLQGFQTGELTVSPVTQVATYDPKAQPGEWWS
jgi:hypothetical protein